MQISIINVIIFLLIIASVVLSVYSLVNTMGKGGGPPGPSGNIGNPFDEKRFTYVVNPHLTNEIDDAGITGATKTGLNKPAAFWIDSISAIDGKVPQDTTGLNTDIFTDGKWPTKDLSQTLQAYLDSAKKSNNSKKPNTAVFIVYDLPGRDCAANSSNGELAATQDGLDVYKNVYITNLYKLLSQYKDLNLVAIIEPDSLANLVTNSDQDKCKPVVTLNLYTDGIIYAINQLGKLPNISIYIDAAHGGWLGYANNYPGYTTQFCDNVLTKIDKDTQSKIRGFATNVSNYQPLGVSKPGKQDIEPCNKTDHDNCGEDPCNLLENGNFGNNEINYIRLLDSSINRCAPTKNGWKYITDTGRNGNPDARKDAIGIEAKSNGCSNWCNINGALGLNPTSDTAIPDLIDAYFWLKTPGESDGCSRANNDSNPKKCDKSRIDNMCENNKDGASWQFRPAPNAGGFDGNIATTLYNNKRNLDFN